MNSSLDSAPAHEIPPTPRVTVAICTFNRAAVLAQTLDSVSRLKVPAGFTWEVLVVDNASTDDTPAVLRSMRTRLPLRAVREPQQGQSYARNLVLREARGDLILWTDDDVVLPEDWLLVIVHTFQETDADFVYGRAEAEWPGKQAPAWYSRRVDGLFALLDYGAKPFRATTTATPFFGLNFAGRRSAHRLLGDFRVDYGVRGTETGGGLGEDIEMYERALARGMNVQYQPSALVRHVIPPPRATKPFHWKKALLKKQRFYANLIAFESNVPWLAGLPRYYYRYAISDFSGLLRNIVSGNRAERFYYELQVLQFLGLVWTAAQWKLRPGTRTVKALKPTS